MRHSIIATIALLAPLFAQPSFAQPSVPEIPFDSVPDYFKYPAEMNLGELSGVAVNSKGHVFMGVRDRSSPVPPFGALATQLLEFDESTWQVYSRDRQGPLRVCVRPRRSRR